MRSAFMFYLMVICFSIGEFAHASIVLNTESTDCSLTRDECELAEAGECLVTLPDEGRPVEPPIPKANKRSRFRSCVGPAPIDSGSGGMVPTVELCELNRLLFTNEDLVTRPGPQSSSRNAYNFVKVFSAGFNEDPPRSYRRHEFSLFNVHCNGLANDSIMSVTLSTHELDPRVSCSGGPKCVDIIRTFVPTEDVCETCGSKPLTCMPGGPQDLPDILHFDGIGYLGLEFQANGASSNRLRAFEFLITCVSRSYFFSDLCIEDTSSGRLTRRNVENMVPTLPRARRSYRKTSIVVTADTTVAYSNFTVRVFRDGVWLYKFPNTQFFQVFNFVVGFRTFSGDATPEGRTFPGYGILKIGVGVIQFIQTAIEPEFLPSPEETEIILRLQRRIIPALETNRDPLIPDDDDDDPIVAGLPGPTFSDGERTQMDMDAERFGRACNGILRANACIYQELFFEPEDISPDCMPIL